MKKYRLNLLNGDSLSDTFSNETCDRISRINLCDYQITRFNAVLRLIYELKRVVLEESEEKITLHDNLNDFT